MWLIFFGGVLVLLLAALAGRSERDPPTIPAGAVAVVEGASGRGVISQAAFHDALRQQSGFAGLEKIPSPANPKYEGLKEAALGELLTAIWLQGQGEGMGIRIDHGAVGRKLAESGERATLEEAGMTLAAIYQRIRTQLLVERIERSLEEPGLGERQQQERFHEFDLEFIERWRSRTYCADGYVIERCANFVLVHPPGAPPACYEADPRKPATECPAPVVQAKPTLPGTVTPSRPEGTRLAQRPIPR